MTETRTRVLLLGAYGFFGSRIAAGLARNPRVQLILAGRDLTKATALAYQLGLTADSARRVDADEARLGLLLRKLGVNMLIHTAGPFQGQDYHVARAAIEARCHYLDLADSRVFVNGVTCLDAAARTAQIAVITGVSSLPALSARWWTDISEHFRASIRFASASAPVRWYRASRRCAPSSATAVS